MPAHDVLCAHSLCACIHVRVCGSVHVCMCVRVSGFCNCAGGGSANPTLDVLCAHLIHVICLKQALGMLVLAEFLVAAIPLQTVSLACSVKHSCQAEMPWKQLHGCDDDGSQGPPPSQLQLPTASQQ